MDPTTTSFLKVLLLSFFPISLHFLAVLLSNTCRPRPLQMADAGGQPQLTQVTSDPNTLCKNSEVKLLKKTIRVFAARKTDRGVQVLHPGNGIQ